MSPLERLEQAWRAWRPGQEPPRWADLLPAGDADDDLCLLEIDAEMRAAAGLPGLLAEPYLARVPLDDARVAELIRWDYRQRRKHGWPASAGEYAAAFPRHADALAGLSSTRDCPVCGRPTEGDADDADLTINCPRCAGPTPPPPEEPGTLDLRRHELLDALGAGGMGEVYRTRDPALGRDLALKVLRPSFASDPRVERRFLREARITASLQHPNIVPVHGLGRLPDGRLFFTMKLVRGRTLERLISDGAPGLLAVFERICEAVAYAHGQGVIHRDLKPANVMVGGFGEVQVMDWGLARAGASRGREPSVGLSDDADEGPANTLAMLAAAGRAGRTLATVATRAGTVMGTPAFMPPEQARGEPIDERADVFALGAILCNVLTGGPPFLDDALARARAGDLAGAFARVDACAADPGLVSLCKECLAPDAAKRPADAGVVAARMAAHREGVERRLREAELERVETREAARRGRLRLALFGAVALLVALSAVAWAWARERQAETDRQAVTALAEARRLGAAARETPLDPAGYEKAEQAAEAAARAAGAASAGLKADAAALLSSAAEERLDGARDRVLLAALLEALGPDRVTYETSASGASAFSGPSAETLLADAFRARGIDVDAAPEAETLAALRSRPPAVAREIAAALDGWWLLRRSERDPRAGRLLALASALDDDPDASEVRVLVAKNRIAVPPAMLAGALVGRAVPFPAPVQAHPVHLRLLALTSRDAAAPPASVALLARALVAVGEPARAERLLRDAIRARPGEAFLHQTLGRMLSNNTPPDWRGAAECYAAARALRPELGSSLALALGRARRGEEALALATLLAERSARDVEARMQLAALTARFKPGEGPDAYRRVLEIAPNHPAALSNLASALLGVGDDKGAADAARRAIAAAPDFAEARGNLASALLGLGRAKEALAEADEAARLKPVFAPAHYLRGLALFDLRRFKEAAAAFRRATAIDPADPRAHANLGVSLMVLRDREGAIAAYRRAVAADANYGTGYANLGAALYEAGRPAEALAPLRRAVVLSPKLWSGHAALGSSLLALGRHAEAATHLRRALRLLPPTNAARPHVEAALKKAEAPPPRKSGIAPPAGPSKAP